ncbi:hypothetical protein JCM10207_003674 [Rhodosporidiobolus poonsookiae]
MPTRRDWVLACAALTALSCGTNYSFSAYAPQLANRLGLTSTQTNAVGAAGNMGVYLSSPFIGRLVDRRGPVPPLLFAAVSLFSGYLLIRSFYDGAESGAGLFASLGVPGLVFAELLTGVGSTAGLSAAGNTVAKSYKKKRAAALSVVLSGFGLSAFFYSTLAFLFIHPREGSRDATSDFLLMLALGCLISMTIGLIFVRPVLHPSLAPSPPVDPANAPDSAEEVDATAAVPVEDDLAPSPSERTPLVRTASAKSVQERNVAGWALLREADFYLIFLFNGLCAGVGLCYINNLGTVVRSLALSTSTSSPFSANDIALAQSRLVSLLSFCNFLGRLFSGFGSDFLLHHKNPNRRLPRVWWLVFTASMYFLSQIAASLATTVEGWHGLALPTILTGFAHGSLFGLSGIIGLERFGMANFSSTNGILALAPALFGQSTNLIFGRIYDSHARSLPPSLSPLSSILTAAGPTCTEGRACYLSAFRLTTGMAGAAICVGLVLATLRKGMRVRAA